MLIAVCRVIQQIFGYMKVNHLKYGILTNYNRFYFMKRENNLLHVSKSVPRRINPNVGFAGFLWVPIGIRRELLADARKLSDCRWIPDFGIDFGA